MTLEGTRRITVLLVEDSTDARDMLRMLLELHGIRVVAASCAEEALAAGRQIGLIDVLVADLRLPDGEGDQIAACLADIHPEMRSLFLSGHPAPPLAAGQAFLRKPARIAAILGEIRALLPQSAYGRAS